MITQTILKPIGKGQITIPQEWRKAIGIEGKSVRAFLEGDKIVIKSLEDETIDWDIKAIKLDKLNDETIQAIKKSQENYLNGDKKAFLSNNDFWEDV